MQQWPSSHAGFAFLEDLMRLWPVFTGRGVGNRCLRFLLAQYAGSQFEYIARVLGATPSFEFVKSVVADLQSNDFAALEEKLDRSYVDERSRSVFAEINRQLPSSPPKSIRLASLSWTPGPPRRTTLSLCHRMPPHVAAGDTEPDLRVQGNPP
jgi:hypothetical protein